MKILTILTILILSTSCSSTNKTNTKDLVEKKSKTDEFVNTTNTEFAIELPENITQVTDFKKKKFSLGEKNNIFFEFMTASGGNYWVTVKPIERELSQDAEVILNINAETPESISLVKIDSTTFHGIGMERNGLVNLDLILRVPRQKTIVFNIDLTMEQNP